MVSFFCILFLLIGTKSRLKYFCLCLSQFFVLIQLTNKIINAYLLFCQLRDVLNNGVTWVAQFFSRYRWALHICSRILSIYVLFNRALFQKSNASWYLPLGKRYSFQYFIQDATWHIVKWQLSKNYEKKVDRVVEGLRYSKEDPERLAKCIKFWGTFALTFTCSGTPITWHSKKLWQIQIALEITYDYQICS